MFNRAVSFLFTALREIDRMEKADAVMDFDIAELRAVFTGAGHDVARGIERGASRAVGTSMQRWAVPPTRV